MNSSFLVVLHRYLFDVCFPLCSDCYIRRHLGATMQNIKVIIASQAEGICRYKNVQILLDTICNKELKKTLLC